MSKLYQVNFELFYDIEEGKSKGFEEDIDKLNIAKKKVSRIFKFDVLEEDEIECFECTDTHNVKYLVSNDINIPKTTIERSEFKKAYRKYHTSRLHSYIYAFPSFTDKTENFIIDISIDKFQGPGNVILAYALIESSDETVPGSDIINYIREIIKINLPNSSNGKQTSLTPHKIAMTRKGWIIPFTKLLPRFVSKKYSQKICELLDERLREKHLERWNLTKLQFEYKWVRVPTGVILVRERYNELVNPITNNKIDTLFVDEIWPAFDVDLVLHILRSQGMRPYSGKQMNIRYVGDHKFRYSRSLSIADNYARHLINMLTLPSKICPIEVERKISNYFHKTIKYIDNFEKVRETKRSLNNME